MGKRSNVSDSEIISLHRNGLGLRRISIIVGMSKGGVNKRLRTIGIDAHPAPQKKISACKRCGREIWGDQKIFCSRSCSASFYNEDRKVFRKCKACKAPHKNKIFCSYACSNSQRRLSDEVRAERYRIKNLVGVRRYQARRYAQTPTDADQHQIKEIYSHCPEGHEVDHVIPISKGGLHHQHNLQYLPMPDNRRKSNKMDYTPVAERLGI